MDDIRSVTTFLISSCNSKIFCYDPFEDENISTKISNEETPKKGL